MSPGIVEDVDRIGTGEDGKPADNRVGEEVRLFGFEDAIARAGHAGHSAAKQSFGEVRSQAELGTEGNGSRVPRPEGLGYFRMSLRDAIDPNRMQRSGPRLSLLNRALFGSLTVSAAARARLSRNVSAVAPGAFGAIRDFYPHSLCPT